MESKGELRLRKAHTSDEYEMACVIHYSFTGIAKFHNIQPDFVTIERTVFVVRAELADKSIEGFVVEFIPSSEQENEAKPKTQVVGCAFRSIYDDVLGVDIIGVLPEFQGRGIGRMLMNELLKGVNKEKVKSARLVQDSFNSSSFSLYASLGFVLRQPLVVIPGSAPDDVIEPLLPNETLRAMTVSDIPECSQINKNMNGFDRTNELTFLINTEKSGFIPHVLLRDGKIVSYSCGANYNAHSCCESERHFLIFYTRLNLLHASEQMFRIIYCPGKYSDIIQFCLSHKLKVKKLNNLMVLGDYKEPPEGSVYISSCSF
eukprot:TRINITY_DN4240_c0_g1_i3.p1 TRINITY_DN4240_c0_g1~~TRINITY_DN4240_c0_g1_i3.p1  ORF type:complete len:317 (+),score=40.54 TRINITY_DN4240_c0_g1_i3:256-1206(+)